MKFTRILLSATLLASGIGLAANACAEGKPLTILVPFAAGGSVDATARILAERMKFTLGRTVIVENKPGAGGRIGLTALKNLPRDGSTVLLGSTSLVLNSIVFEDSTPYNFRKDFVSVAQVGRTPMGLAIPYASPIASVQDFIRRSPDKVFTFGTNGIASFSHLIGLKFAKVAQLQPNAVAYQGGAPMANDLMGGQINAAVDTQADFVERHNGKKLKVLASFGRERSDLLPDVPTMSEVGIHGIDGELWFGVVAASGEQPAFMAEVQEGIRKALEDPSAREKLRKLMSVDFRTGKELSETISKDFSNWTPIITEFGLKNAK